VGLIADEGDNHAVEVEEEHQEMETELDERLLYGPLAVNKPDHYSVQLYLLVNIQLAEDFGCVQKMLVLEDPIVTRSVSTSYPIPKPDNKN
jgi:hypothetical protein